MGPQQQELACLSQPGPSQPCGAQERAGRMSKIAEVIAAFRAAKAACKHVHMYTSVDMLTSYGIPMAFAVGGFYFAGDGMYKMIAGVGKGDLRSRQPPPA